MHEIYKIILPCLGMVSLALSLFDYFISKSSKTKKSLLIDNMNKISNLIKEGGFSCLNAQYIPALIIALGIYIFCKFYLLKDILSYGIGIGFLSCIACVYYCFTVAMSGNIRTAISSLQSLNKGFQTSYRFGRSVGLFITSLSLFIISLFFFYKKADQFEFMLGVAIGVSIVGIFARLAGGIFTKGADIGADLVGKVIKDMPEDDPRNPGTIADNIGDNIGDCVGTAADIHETYILAFMAIAYFGNFGTIMIPMIAATIGSILGVNFIQNPNIGEGESEVWSKMFQMILASLTCSVILFIGLSIGYNVFQSLPIYTIDIRSIVSFFMGILYIPGIFLIINYYTSKTHYPVQSLAESCKSGTAMNVIGGYAISLQSAFVVIFFSCSVGFGVYQGFGTDGLLVLISTVLGFVTSVMTMDTYGPITDNAGGIVTMVGAPDQARHNTDILDSIGNLTKALTKGYSSGITILTAFLLLTLYFTKSESIYNISLKATNPIFLFGALLGAAVPFLFSGLVINSVHKAASYMLEVIQKIINTMDPSDKLYYKYPIKSLSERSVRYMILPLLSILSPALVAAVIYLITNQLSTQLNKTFFIYFLSGSLIGTCSSGLLLSIAMTIGGAAWDNAKKLTEETIGPKMKAVKHEIEQLIENLSSVKPKSVSIDSLQMISDSLNDLIKLNVTDSDKASIFDTFKQAITNQAISLKNWIQQNKAMINPVNSEPLDVKACLAAIKDGTDKHGAEKVFGMYGELESLKAVKDAAVTGDMLGDPLKDAAGTGLNSMVKMYLILNLSSLFLLSSLA